MLRKSKFCELLPFDTEIERTFRQRRKIQLEAAQQANLDMADNRVEINQNNQNDQNNLPAAVVGQQQNQGRRALRDYMIPLVGNIGTCIAPPAIPANNFEIKPSLISLIQHSAVFHGLPSEDPHVYLRTFLTLCDMQRMNGVPDDAIKLKLFSFSLADKAKAWFFTLPLHTITTFEEMSQKFVNKFFPPGRMSKLRHEILSFSQQSGESIFEAWERFNELVRQCPTHGIADWILVQTFYNGLTNENKKHADSTAGVSVMDLTYEEASEIFEKMAANSYQWYSDRSAPRTGGIAAVNEITALNAKLDALTKKIDSLGVHSVNSVQTTLCDFCFENQAENACLMANQAPSNSEQANFVGNRQQGGPYSHTYNPEWKNHPNFSWSNNRNVQQPPGFQQQQQEQQQYQKNISEKIEVLIQLVKSQNGEIMDQAAEIKNLKRQMGELAASSAIRQPGQLPSNTEVNPREHVNAITTRSGVQLSEVNVEEYETQKKARRRKWWRNKQVKKNRGLVQNLKKKLKEKEEFDLLSRHTPLPSHIHNG